MMTLTVSCEDAGRTVRELLTARLGMSASAVRSARWSDRIRLNGSPSPVTARAVAGDVLSVIPAPDRPAYLPAAASFRLTIPYEDAYFLVIDKPAPLSSVSGPAHAGDSLENALFAHMGCPADFIYRPVSRLDKGTSGLMAAAKDSLTHHVLQEALHTEAFVREYYAVTEGIPAEKEGTIDAPIGKVSPDSVVRTVTADGRPAVTHYRTERVSGNRALVRLRLETGRTHQIRVHLAHIGCPVAGDYLYGTPDARLPGRFALHSAYLRLNHPVTGRAMEWESPLPPELDALLEAAEGEKP